jgi:hypothetical protein
MFRCLLERGALSCLRTADASDEKTFALKRAGYEQSFIENSKHQIKTAQNSYLD